jgi:hypothetical protein
MGLSTEISKPVTKKSSEVCATKRYKWPSHYHRDNTNKGTETSYILEYSTASCESH